MHNLDIPRNVKVEKYKNDRIKDLSNTNMHFYQNNMHDLSFLYLDEIYSEVKGICILKEIFA